MPNHILFISSWYPTPEKKSQGIFFKRHAEAAALLNQISELAFRMKLYFFWTECILVVFLIAHFARNKKSKLKYTSSKS